MNNYWKGFGLLFAWMALFLWYSHYDRGKDLERSLIDRDPSIAAQRDFREGQVSFFKVFQLTNRKEGPLGEWIIPGEKRIGEDILDQYTKRKRLDVSFNLRLNEDQESIAQRAHKSALVYNLEMLSQIRTSMRCSSKQDQEESNKQLKRTG